MIWVLSRLGDGFLGYAVCGKVIQASRVGVFGVCASSRFWRSGQGHMTGKMSSEAQKAVTARRGQKDRSRRLRKQKRQGRRTKKEARKHTHTAVSERAAVVWNRR